MKNIRFVLLIVLALFFGLGAGYLLFRGEKEPESRLAQGGSAPEHDHAGTEEGETIYTCSMHPQVRQPEPGDCPICGMELIPLSEARSDDPLVLEMTPEAVRLAQLETQVVGSDAAGENTLTLNGTIRADERRVSSLVAHVPGRIDKLYVSFTGEQVTRGQPIAELYAPRLVSAQRELLEALKWKDSNPRLLEAARGKLRNWLMPESFIREVEESGEIQQHITLYAETGGVVQKRFVAVGDHVAEGGALFEVVDLNRLWVLLEAYEDNLSEVEVGDRVSFSTPALPGQTFQTRITYIDPVIDPSTRIASLRGEINNPGGRLKPEMFVRATLQHDPAGEALLSVPKSAVMWTGKRSVVYVAVPNRTVPSYEFREVVLGGSLGDRYLIEDGLSPGEEVVTYGAFAIDAAAQLNNQRSMINRQVSIKGSETAKSPDYQASTPADFQAQLHDVADAYLRVKDALVNSDPVSASEAAADLGERLQAVDMMLLEGDAHNFWMKQSNAIRSHALNISKADILEEQRQQFDFLSQALITSLKSFGSTEALYVQHCPMAFDNQGADWLSLRSEIRNPYYGDAMLTCGSVTDSLGQ